MLPILAGDGGVRACRRERGKRENKYISQARFLVALHGMYARFDTLNPTRTTTCRHNNETLL